jgi:lipopolysaccharide/colanic/teichoic acid biosynthesis glycosyltransferase
MGTTRTSEIPSLSEVGPLVGDGPISLSVSERQAAIERIAALRHQDAANIESGLAYLTRRTVEVTLALFALILSAPLLLLVVIIVKFDTPGPALFRQRRVGKNGKLFTFYKIRTLYADARERFPEMYKYQFTPKEVQELSFKREEDPRITPAGKWLRKSTLDELPNFWNLFVGDVSLVGPRPEIPEMLAHYRDEQLTKFTVRPGITGLAQTNGRGNLSFQQTIAWDMNYVQNQSLWLDIKILVRTFRVLTDGSF